MKRITAVLVLMMAGVLVSTAPLLPGEVMAGDLPPGGFEIPNPKDDFLGDLQGKPGDDNEGDPDAGGDGLGFDDPDDVWDESGVSMSPDRQMLKKLWIFLKSSVWLVS